ncbi:MAG: 16S rRNA (cytidine(1402)-2'-O)-methyltransferase [Actinomycetota bacterium]
MKGRLILCGTPIGNLEDMSPRALRTLQEVDVVACEDTRRTRKLLSHHGIKARALTSYHEGNEKRRAKELTRRITQGEVVALVSDAGMPGLSDPGYRLVRECIDAEIDIELVPGPSAVVGALAMSGLPTGRFAFEGFLPRKGSERRRHVEGLIEEPRTLVFYESPHRIADVLADLRDLLGDRPAALARELTKLHEEVRRGTLSELVGSVERDPPRGEIVLVVGGAVRDHRAEIPAEELARQARALMDQGVDRKEAMAEVARAAGVSRRKVFDALLEH